jgi:hypothetical protein
MRSGVKTGDTAVELGQVHTDRPAAVAEAITGHNSICWIEELERTDDRLLSKYETTDVGIYEFVESSSLPPQFPIVAVNGVYELDLTGTVAEFERLRAVLAEIDRPYRLVSKVHTDETTPLLTDRQREVLSAALRAGYLAVPRDCSLAELAETLDADKSTVSGVLRRAQERLAAWYLTDDVGASPEL